MSGGLLDAAWLSDNEFWRKGMDQYKNNVCYFPRMVKEQNDIIGTGRAPYNPHEQGIPMNTPSWRKLAPGDPAPGINKGFG